MKDLVNNQYEIRETNSNDLEKIYSVQKAAFPTEEEAELTISLINDETSSPFLSLLAFDGDKAVGHILFTRAYLNNRKQQPLIHILAPLAVIPEYQKKGIGGNLINAGLLQLKALDTKIVFVLGHINYYPKYGFIPDAMSKGYMPPFPIAQKHADAWMLQTLNSCDEIASEATVLCAEALNKPEYWSE